MTRRADRHKLPYFPPEYTPADINAIQALERGEADESQQRRALAWIINASGVDDLSYRPDNPHDTSFAEGKRFVGLQIRKMLSADPVKLAEKLRNQ